MLTEFGCLLKTRVIPNFQSDNLVRLPILICGLPVICGFSEKGIPNF